MVLVLVAASAGGGIMMDLVEEVEDLPEIEPIAILIRVMEVCNFIHIIFEKETHCIWHSMAGRRSYRSESEPLIAPRVNHLLLRE